MNEKLGIVGGFAATALICATAGLTSVEKSVARSEVIFSRPACAAAYACVWSRSMPLARWSAVIVAKKPIINADTIINTSSVVINAIPDSSDLGAGLMALILIPLITA